MCFDLLRCNTLEHITAHYSALQHTTAHYNTQETCFCLNVDVARKHAFEVLMRVWVACSVSGLFLHLRVRVIFAVVFTVMLHARVVFAVAYQRQSRCGVLQCVVVCCISESESFLLHVAVCCHALQCAALCCISESESFVLLRVEPFWLLFVLY